MFTIIYVTEIPWEKFSFYYSRKVKKEEVSVNSDFIHSMLLKCPM